MVQTVLMCATRLGAIPVLQEVLSVSYGVVLSMAVINGFFYNLYVLLSDPVVPGWITPAIPIIAAFLTDGCEMDPERTQALITMQLILGLIFLVFGITGTGGEMVHLVPSPVKAGVLMGGGLVAIIGEMGEIGCFWTYPISITVGVLVAYFCSSSPIQANLRRKYKAIDLIGKFGMLPAIIIGVVLGPTVRGTAVPVVQLWPLIKIPELGNIWNQLSPFAIGWPSTTIRTAAIPTVTVVYIIAFGDFVTSEELLRSADEVHQDEKVDFNTNRPNVISSIRNVAMALCCPYAQTCGPLWAVATAAMSQRYKEGPKAMESIYSGADTFRWCTLTCVALIPIFSLLQPVLPVVPSLTLTAQGFICTQLAMNMYHTDTKRGICGVTGVVLTIQGAAWGLAMGLVPFFMLFEGRKKASEQVAVDAADDKADQQFH